MADKHEVIETTRKFNLSGTYDYYLLKDRENGSWCVQCFEVQDGDPDGDSSEFQWEVTSKLVGYKDNNPNREIREPFTEETAREEFARWK